MEKILPIGTIIKARKNKFLIMGYSFGKADDALQVVYNALLYPIGFTGGNHYVEIPSTADMEIIYKPEALDNRYTEVLEHFQKEINSVGVEEATEIMRDFIADAGDMQEVD